ncbi:uncharacterized protein CLUP02_01505 [Colletotrichum lupini]|uniref:Uncharacterized protein n=1 Tax=Colletotrichum lupini TaxID=145971 RepID=A0A9Q8SD30_9PEZI|nr:uncharacterized protein CLUP02_01505 [Colletotrichum lupini]UQC74853.1 hypothetical protein CLUP02_01505 [Colletotrichum lupini]
MSPSRWLDVGFAVIVTTDGSAQTNNPVIQVPTVCANNEPSNSVQRPNFIPFPQSLIGHLQGARLNHSHTHTHTNDIRKANLLYGYKVHTTLSVPAFWDTSSGLVGYIVIAAAFPLPRVIKYGYLYDVPDMPPGPNGSLRCYPYGAHKIAVYQLPSHRQILVRLLVPSTLLGRSRRMAVFALCCVAAHPDPPWETRRDSDDGGPSYPIPDIMGHASAHRALIITRQTHHHPTEYTPHRRRKEPHPVCQFPGSVRFGHPTRATSHVWLWSTPCETGGKGEGAEEAQMGGGRISMHALREMRRLDRVVGSPYRNPHPAAPFAFVTERIFRQAEIILPTFHPEFLSNNRFCTAQASRLSGTSTPSPVRYTPFPVPGFPARRPQPLEKFLPHAFYPYKGLSFEKFLLMGTQGVMMRVQFAWDSLGGMGLREKQKISRGAKTSGKVLHISNCQISRGRGLGPFSWFAHFFPGSRKPIREAPPTKGPRNKRTAVAKNRHFSRLSSLSPPSHADTVAGAWPPDPRRHYLKGPKGCRQGRKMEKAKKEEEGPSFSFFTQHTPSNRHRIPDQVFIQWETLPSVCSVSTSIHLAWITHGYPWREWHGDLDEPNGATSLPPPGQLRITEAGGSRFLPFLILPRYFEFQIFLLARPSFSFFTFSLSLSWGRHIYPSPLSFLTETTHAQQLRHEQSQAWISIPKPLGLLLFLGSSVYPYATHRQSGVRYPDGALAPIAEELNATKMQRAGTDPTQAADGSSFPFFPRPRVQNTTVPTVVYGYSVLSLQIQGNTIHPGMLTHRVTGEHGRLDSWEIGPFGLPTAGGMQPILPARQGTRSSLCRRLAVSLEPGPISIQNIISPKGDCCLGEGLTGVKVTFAVSRAKTRRVVGTLIPAAFLSHKEPQALKDLHCGVTDSQGLRARLDSPVPVTRASSSLPPASPRRRGLLDSPSLLPRPAALSIPVCTVIPLSVLRTPYVRSTSNSTDTPAIPALTLLSGNVTAHTPTLKEDLQNSGYTSLLSGHQLNHPAGTRWERGPAS